MNSIHSQLIRRICSVPFASCYSGKTISLSKHLVCHAIHPQRTNHSSASFNTSRTFVFQTNICDDRTFLGNDKFLFSIQHNFHQFRPYSEFKGTCKDLKKNAGEHLSETGTEPKIQTEVEIEPKEEESKGIIGRFKDAYKQYGKVLIGVHLATSTVWFGSFYYLAYSGLDIVALLTKLGAGEVILKAAQVPGVGHAAVAYLLYKLATPARYTVTIGGTHLAVKQLKRLGYIKPIPKGDSFRDLVKDSRTQVTDKIKDRVKEGQDRYDTYKDKFHDLKDDFKDKMKDSQTKTKNGS